jgi:hypothetical protein
VDNLSNHYGTPSSIGPRRRDGSKGIREGKGCLAELAEYSKYWPIFSLDERINLLVRVNNTYLSHEAEIET